jgi:hypothetical protein
LQKKKVWVLGLVPMDLFDKVEKITMISLLILYNTNLIPFAICAQTPLVDPKQQGLGVKEKLQEADTSIPTRRKKNKRKVAHEVIIREVNMRTSSSNLSISRKF